MLIELIKLMRLNQSIKHIFVIPGIIFGYYVSKNIPNISHLVISFIAIILLASSNYIMNEITDRKFDIYHNLKKNRTMVKKAIDEHVAWLFYFIVLFLGIGFSLMINKFFFFIALLFSMSAIIYNLKPLRLKNLPIVDVICESFNNPIRFLFGFSLFFNDITIPSLSLLLSYWLAGAFLMNSKRLSEYCYFQNLKITSHLKKYRYVYKFYNFENLNALSIFYATFSLALLSIFIIKHRIEYILVLPIITFTFAWYHFLSLKKFKIMQEIKNLAKSKILILLILLLFIVFLFSTFYEIKILSILLNQNITIKF